MSHLVRITRRIEFDAGHRIPEHNSKCFNVHGHRYVLEASLVGHVIDRRGPDDGMVLDFGDLKDWMQNAVGDVWDHGFLVFKYDTPLVEALLLLDAQQSREHKTIFLPVVPTVENLARIAFEKIATIIPIMPNQTFHLSHVRLYETPNCWADYTPMLQEK